MNTDNLDKEFQEFFFQISTGMGHEGVISKIIGIMFLEPKEISLEELAKKTGYSLSAVSTAMKLFENWNTVKRIKKPGSRKKYFYMEKDLKKLVKGKFKKMREVYFSPAKTKLPVLIEKYRTKLKNSKDDYSNKKLNILKNYHAQIIVMDKLMEDFMKKVERID